MNEILIADGLTKTFRLSAKQQKLEGAKARIKLAVNDLSFSVNCGEVFGLLGPNGAGKTTTLRMLATLLRPDSGDAVIDGASVLRQPEQVRARIGFLTSELRFEEFFTPNYLYDFFAALHKVEPSVRDRRKAAIFRTFGIGEFAEVKVANLSSGMKQKTSLAISLVHDPDVIIFDEPTNGLDVLTAKVVTDYLLSLREQGKTIVLSTHIFSLAERLCDRVGVIVNGHMTACGTLAEIQNGMSLEDRFFELYRDAMGVEA